MAGSDCDRMARMLYSDAFNGFQPSDQSYVARTQHSEDTSMLGRFTAEIIRIAWLFPHDMIPTGIVQHAIVLFQVRGFEADFHGALFNIGDIEMTYLPHDTDPLANWVSWASSLYLLLVVISLDRQYNLRPHDS